MILAGLCCCLGSQTWWCDMIFHQARRIVMNFLITGEKLLFSKRWLKTPVTVVDVKVLCHQELCLQSGFVLIAPYLSKHTYIPMTWFCVRINLPTKHTDPSWDMRDIYADIYWSAGSVLEDHLTKWPCDLEWKPRDIGTSQKSWGYLVSSMSLYLYNWIIDMELSWVMVVPLFIIHFRLVLVVFFP